MPAWFMAMVTYRLVLRIVEWTKQQPQTPGWTCSSLYTTLTEFLGGHAHRCRSCVWSTCDSLDSWAKDKTHQEEVHTYADGQKKL